MRARPGLVLPPPVQGLSKRIFRNGTGPRSISAVGSILWNLASASGSVSCPENSHAYPGKTTYVRGVRSGFCTCYVLLDGTLAECDRVGDSRADFSQKHRRHGVNVQVVADPAGNLLWISPALPGRTHDPTAARAHRIIRICERQGVPVPADRAYIGAGPWVTTPIRRLPNRDLTTTQHTINRALSAARAPVERSVARLKSWRIFRKARCSPNRMTAIAAAVLTLERQR